MPRKLQKNSPELKKLHQQQTHATHIISSHKYLKPKDQQQIEQILSTTSYEFLIQRLMGVHGRIMIKLLLKKLNPIKPKNKNNNPFNCLKQ